MFPAKLFLFAVILVGCLEGSRYTVILCHLAMMQNIVVQNNKHLLMIMSLWMAERFFCPWLGSFMKSAVRWIGSSFDLDQAFPVWALPESRLI